MNLCNTFIIKTIVLISLVSLMSVANVNATNVKNDTEKKNVITSQSEKLGVKPLSQQSKPTLESNSEIGVTNYVQMLFGLFAIIIFIFAVAWLIKRMGTLNPNHSTHLKIVAGLSVGQREKIVIVQVMDEQFLVGITQSNIQLLNKLEQSIPVQNMPTLGGFQEKLQSAMSNFTKKSDAGNNA